MEIITRCYQRKDQLNNGMKTIKKLQNIFGRFLYYARSIDPTISMALNSLAAVQTKPTIYIFKTYHKLQSFTSIHRKRIHKKRDYSPYIFVCILNFRAKGTAPCSFYVDLKYVQRVLRVLWGVIMIT